DEFPALADIALAPHLGPLEAVVVALPAGGAAKAADDALNHLVVVDPELDDGIEPAFLFLQHFVEGAGLRQRARKAVEDDAAPAIGLIDALGNNLDHDLVGYELSLVHDRLGALTGRRSRGAGRPQHVPGGKLDEAVSGGDLFGLCPLARTRRPEQDQVDHRRVAPLSFAFLMRPSYWWASRWPCTCATVSIVTLTAINSEVPPK